MSTYFPADITVLPYEESESALCDYLALRELFQGYIDQYQYVEFLSLEDMDHDQRYVIVVRRTEYPMTLPDLEAGLDDYSLREVAIFDDYHLAKETLMYVVANTLPIEEKSHP